jgi:hypothetical protein
MINRSGRQLIIAGYMQMRVLGIGIDLVKNSRIEHVITKNHAERFIKKFLHPS